MAKDKVRMPSTQGGLVRYYDEEYKSRFMFKPIYIVAAVIAICAVVVGLHLLKIF